MPRQYPRSAFQGLCGVTRMGQQQLATQSLCVHLLGLEFVTPPLCSAPKQASLGTSPLSPKYFRNAPLFMILFLGKRKHTPPCSSAELFLAQKNGGVNRGKISVVDMAFLVFIGFLYLPPAWKVFLRGQKSSPNDFLSVVVVYVFFLLCVFRGTLMAHAFPTDPVILKMLRS